MEAWHNPKCLWICMCSSWLILELGKMCMVVSPFTPKTFLISHKKYWYKQHHFWRSIREISSNPRACLHGARVCALTGMWYMWCVRPCLVGTIRVYLRVLLLSLVFWVKKLPSPYLRVLLLSIVFWVKKLPPPNHLNPIGGVHWKQKFPTKITKILHRWN
jgi:hypothetical protein